MSEYETTIVEALTKQNVLFEREKNIKELETWPWKSGRSKYLRPDFYLPDKKLYVEVKGFMTLESMFKIGWLLDNLHKYTDCYYCLIQASEHIYILNEVQAKTQVERKRKKLEIQIEKLIILDPVELNRRSMLRVKNFISYWLERYKTCKVPLFQSIEILS